MIVVSIGIAHTFSQAFDASGIALFHTGAWTAGDAGREGNALNRAHLPIAFADANGQNVTSVSLGAAAPLFWTEVRFNESNWKTLNQNLFI